MPSHSHMALTGFLMTWLKYKIKNGKKLSKHDDGQKKKAAGKKYMYIMSYILIFFEEKGITHYQKLKGITIKS